jgi:5-deoxy-glucuronate isomerase
MHKLIRNYNNNNQPVLDAGNRILPLTIFNRVRLENGDEFSVSYPNHESVWVVQKGSCDIKVNDLSFQSVGQRKDIWSGNADSVYAGTGSFISVKSNSDVAEIAVAGGHCETKYQAFRIFPEDVEMVDVGSDETHTHRRIFHILGQNAAGRAGNLLVSELYCEGGCWSGYPPHKHDTENYPEETAFEELYHYRFNPENGFGGQFIFDEDIEEQVFMTHNGDTFAFNSGYHPTVTSPGHQEYIFTILVGKNQRSLIQNFKPEYRYLMDRIPGIRAMRDKFK